MGYAFAQLLALDGGSAAPLQQQVYVAVRRAILEGLLTPGTRLPSTRTLAGDLGVSRTTTLLAYEQLLAEGYLDARHGSGTFVAHDLPDDLPPLLPGHGTSVAAHPALSRRGERLASIPPPALRIDGPLRAFRVGVPALDLFPAQLWSRLVGQCTRAMRAADLDYTDPAGLPRLRDAIARHVAIARGARCAPDQIVIVAGAQRGIDLISRLLLDPGDEAWLEEPGYAGARSALVGADARIVPVAVDRDGLDVEAGLRQAPRARLAYVTPSHQFPLGVHMSLPRRLALLKWAREADAWIVEDDYDSEFRYGLRPIPALHGLDADGRVIYVGSFSKSLFPSLRLGFLIVPPALAPKLLDVRRASDVHPPALDQATVAAFIDGEHYDRHLRRMRAAYRERVEAMASSFARYCGGAVRLRPVTTGLHAVADLHGCDAAAVADECVARGIEVTPLATYFMHPRSAGHGLVLGFAGVDAAAIQAGAQELAESIEAAQKAARQSAWT